ncbi:MAG: response regulator [Deltaproteobacteria bacterium]|nr:response regulator [Deltaproteobacteria bacterium]
MRDPIKIVVIDDEPIVGERLKAMLVRDGHRVENFVNPLRAIDRLQETDVDIVITDIRMAEMDGIQVLEKVLEKSRHTRVIMISGYATLDLAKESLTKGAFDFIAKPFKLKELRNTIKKAVKSLDRENDQPASAASA